MEKRVGATLILVQRLQSSIRRRGIGAWVEWEVRGMRGGSVRAANDVRGSIWHAGRRSLPRPLSLGRTCARDVTYVTRAVDSRWQRAHVRPKLQDQEQPFAEDVTPMGRQLHA
ncbi:unnamed protein product, partial [Iphiclides podalirius]